jgi:hypothetical protein
MSRVTLIEQNSFYVILKAQHRNNSSVANLADGYLAVVRYVAAVHVSPCSSSLSQAQACSITACTGCFYDTDRMQRVVAEGDPADAAAASQALQRLMEPVQNAWTAANESSSLEGLVSCEEATRLTTQRLALEERPQDGPQQAAYIWANIREAASPASTGVSPPALLGFRFAVMNPSMHNSCQTSVVLTLASECWGSSWLQ